MEPANQRALLPFVRRVKKLYPNKTIWCFTGFLLDEELQKESYARCEVTDELLSMIDVLVDGRFEEEKRDLTLRFRGSSNQRLINVPASLQQGQVVLWEDWQGNGRGLKG